MKNKQRVILKNRFKQESNIYTFLFRNLDLSKRSALFHHPRKKHHQMGNCSCVADFFHQLYQLNLRGKKMRSNHLVDYLTFLLKLMMVVVQHHLFSEVLLYLATIQVGSNFSLHKLQQEEVYLGDHQYLAALLFSLKSLKLRAAVSLVNWVLQETYSMTKSLFLEE
jgi:hypothetical protein